MTSDSNIVENAETVPTPVSASTGGEDALTSPPTNPSESDKAGHDFAMLLPLFIQKVEEFSSLRQLKRVVVALMAYPLEPRFVMKFSYPIESEAFNLGQNLSDCKMTLMHSIMSMSEEERAALLKEAEQKEAEANAAAEEQNKETANG